MEAIARQLETVRRAARWMLVGQRLFQWAAALIAVALVLGLIDYALKLPGWLRLVLAVAVVVLAAVWIVGRVRGALRFRPTLDQLALRLEKMYPHLSGQLAAAVDFSTHAERYRAPERTATLVATTLARVRDRLPGVEVRRLLDPSRTVRLLLGLALAAVLLGVVVMAAPQHAAIAARRWVAPLGDAEWPRHTQVHAAGAPAVWPVDTPVRLSAEVNRGYRPGMRVAVEYRVVGPDGRAGAWQEALMTEQAGPRQAQGKLFERQIELPESLVRALEDGGGEARVQYRYRAGDDDTAVAELRVVPRPAVTRVVATVAPPAYAEGLVAVQTTPMHEASGQVASVSALQGSEVTLDVAFNKRDVQLEAPPELADSGGDSNATSKLTARVDDTLEFPLRLTDADGLSNLSERRYRIEAVEDKPVAVSLTRPAADEAVLPTAVVGVQAVAQDDVGVRVVRLEAVLEAPPTTPAEQAVTPTPVTLVNIEGRQPELRAEHALDLATGLSRPARPGDVVVLGAAAEDVFELDGRRHEPVASSPRRLRVIDETEFVAQVRSELAAVRQQAVRLESGQRQLIEAPADQAAGEQAEVTRRAESQERLVRELIDRAERNRLEAPELREMMDRARGLLEQASGASRSAQAKLDEAQRRADDAAKAQAREEAAADQERAAERLEELASLLDQGRDTFALETQLRQLHAQQSDLANEARELLPQTVGRDTESLPQELQDRLRRLAEEQASLGEQAKEMVRQMQETAHALSQQPEDRAKAAAEALAEAAATAQREGLEQQMERSAEAAQQNQLPQAGQSQAQSLQTMQQMMAQMGSQQQRMMAMLRRRLAKLAETLRGLVERQRGQIAALDAAEGEDALPPLEPEQSAVRRATIVAEEDARAAEETAPIADVVSQAVASQGDAVLALRASERLPAKEGETTALASLEEALKQVEGLGQQVAEEQAREAREQLKGEYEKLAKEQDELRTATEPFAEAGRVDRRQRGEVVDLGHRQADLQAAATELRAKVDQTLVFQAMHDRLDTAAGRAARQLRAATPAADVLRDQARVATLLREMAEALGQDQENEPFAGQQQQEQQGGGGGGGQAEVVPPVAELKLLRGLQETILSETRALHDAGDAAAARGSLLELSTQQRELASLGERLVEMMQQANPGAARPEGERE